MKEEEILGILPLHIRTIIKQAGINWDELQEIRLRIQKPVILKYNAKTCYLSEQGKITTRKEQLHIVTSQEIRQAMEYISSYSMYAYIEQLKQGFLTIRGGHRVGICGTVVMDHDKVKTIRHISAGLVLKNYIEIPEERIEKSKIHYDEAIEDQWVIMDLINGIFFEGKLKNNFFTDARDMNIYDDCLKQSILKSRNILANWFWRGEQNQLVKILDDVSLALIKNSILNDETFAAQRKFNLRWSLLEYLDDQEVGVHMSEIRNQLREHINVAKDVEWDFISDEEYSYAVGQAVSYLLHLSKANNKTESYVNPFFNAKNSKVIKQRLLRMYTKYNYQIIHINGGRNAQLLSHVMEYEPKEIKHELIMAGFTAPSLMYEKKTDDEDNE